MWIIKICAAYVLCTHKKYGGNWLMKATKKNDPELYGIVREEYVRQRYNIVLLRYYKI